MSIENAHKFMAGIYAHDKKVLTLLPRDVAHEGLDIKKTTEIAQAAQDAGWEFTADELQEAYLDSLEMVELDEDEFSAVAGGAEFIIVGSKPPSSYNGIHGKCPTNYFVEACREDVNMSKSCSCTDYEADPSYYHKC